MKQETPAQRLAEWVSGLRFEDLTCEAVLHAKRALLDTLGVQLRGATLPWVDAPYQYARSIAGDEAATITLHGDRVHTPYAAYANSAFSYSCELQHHGSPGAGHVGVVVVPVVQALGEQLNATGEEIITAMVAGYEAQGSIGDAIYSPEFQRHYNAKERHFHLAAMLAVFGAAAAAGKLLGLNDGEQAHAFAIAATHASGLMEYDHAGGEVKRIHGAIGARSGIQAAMLARLGLTGPLSVFEGRHGFFAAFGGTSPSDPDALFSDLGEPYCITRCRYRIYPTIGTCHSVIDLVTDLMDEDQFHHSEVEKIRVGLWERGLMHVGAVKRPHDVISAQASLAYSVGLRLVKGSNSLEMYLNPTLWKDAEVLSIADKVEGHVVTRPDAPRYTTVEIQLSNGTVLSSETAHTRGAEEDPFSDEVIKEKFQTLAQVVLPADRVVAIMDAVEGLESLPSMTELVPMLQK